MSSFVSATFKALSEKAGRVALFGAIAGWQAFDWLRAAQFMAAVLASLVSLCALIISAPKAWATLQTAWAKISRKSR